MELGGIGQPAPVLTSDLELILCHPNFVVEVERQQAAELAGLGAVIEHELGMYYDERRFKFSVLLAWINFVGPERTSLGSDLGQVNNPLPVEAYRQIVGNLLDSGIGEKDIQLMIRDSPKSPERVRARAVTGLSGG